MWNSKKSSILKTRSLRKSCPCAWCSGEKDVFGNVYAGTDKNLKKEAYLLVRFEKVGLYGVRFFWGDGHKDGIFTYDLLNSLAS